MAKSMTLANTYWPLSLAPIGSERTELQPFLFSAIARVSGPCVMRMYDTEFKQHYVFGNSDAGRRTGQRGLEEPADEFRLTVSSGFLENAARVGARRRPADLEPRRGRGESISANNFLKNACLGGR